MHAHKVVSVAQARESLGRLTEEVANGRGAVGITRRSRLTAVLVGAGRFEEDMAELERYRRQDRKKRGSTLTGLMEIAGDLAAGSRRLAKAHEAALRRSAKALTRGFVIRSIG